MTDLPDRHAVTDRIDPHDPPAPPVRPARARRLPTAVAALLVVLAGLTVATTGTGPWADALGDALYASLVLLLLRLVAPGLRTRTHVLAALATCAVIEAAQATGVPAAVVEAFPPARFVLGTTFVATDLLAYAVGVLVTAVALAGTGMLVGVRRGRVPSSGAPGRR